MLRSIIRRNLTGPRPFTPLRVLYWLSALAVLVRLCAFVIFEPYYEGDTKILVTEGVEAIRACLAEGRYAGCLAAGPLPLFQYAPSFLLRVLNFSPESVLHFLAYLSFVSFAGSLLLIFLTLKKSASRVTAACALLVMITGPLLWYSHSTFGEMSAAFLMLAFTSAILLRARGWLLAFLFVLAGSTKEIAFPFLLVIGLVCLLPEVIIRPREVRGRLQGLVAGAALSFALNAAFNYFRSGMLYNAHYLMPIQIVPTWKLHLNFFMGIWFSPSGGLLFFWTSFVLLFFALLFFRKGGAEIEGGGARMRRLIFYLPLLAVSLMLLLLTLGFSRWYAPFGWLAWGPRLMLPWIPSLLLVLLHFYSAQVELILTSMLKKTSGLVLTSAFLIFVALPQLMVLFAPIILADIFNPTVDCSRWPPIQEDLPYYYHCLKTVVWPKKLTLLEAFPVSLKPSILLFSICYCVILAGGCYWISKRLGEGRLWKKV